MKDEELHLKKRKIWLINGKFFTLKHQLKLEKTLIKYRIIYEFDLVDLYLTLFLSYLDFSRFNEENKREEVG